jgi:tetratricopeptide (TPR) repeat protein
MRIDFTDLFSKVKLYFAVGRYEAAEKLLLSNIDEHGSLANLHNLLGVTYHKQSKFAEAIVEYNKALKINPNFVEAGLNLAATLCDLGKYDDAKAVFSALTVSIAPNRKQPDLIMGRLANQHAETGRLYEQSGLLNEALTEYKRALMLYERMPDVKVAVGKIYFKLNQFDRALAEFHAVATQYPNEYEAHLWAGITQYKLGAMEGAQSQWRAAKAIEGDLSAASSYLQLTKFMTPHQA